MGYVQRRLNPALSTVAFVAGVMSGAWYFHGPWFTEIGLPIWPSGRGGVSGGLREGSSKGAPAASARADTPRQWVRHLAYSDWSCEATYREVASRSPAPLLTCPSTISFAGLHPGSAGLELEGEQSDHRGRLGRLRAHVLERPDGEGRPVLIVERVDYSGNYTAGIMGLLDSSSPTVTGKFIDSSGRLGEFTMRRLK